MLNEQKLAKTSRNEQNWWRKLETITIEKSNFKQPIVWFVRNDLKNKNFKKMQSIKWGSQQATVSVNDVLFLKPGAN